MVTQKRATFLKGAPAGSGLDSSDMRLDEVDRPLQRVEDRILASAGDIVAVRRRLHRFPELSGEEAETTAYLSNQLKAAGIPHRLGRGIRGIITETFSAQAKTPVVALRADIDALPINEETDAPYRSERPGKMHACGHDAHTAMLFGAVMAMHQEEACIPTGWRAIFQPSEEVGHGAQDLIEQGALDGVDAIVAQHVDPSRIVGQIGVTTGPRTAFCQDFEATVAGRGGHGARPYVTVDPIAVSAQLITLCYQALPREIDARAPVVLTFGAIHGGQANNIIPDVVSLKGTIRGLSSNTAEQARAIVQRLCLATAAAFKANISLEFSQMLPGIVNEAKITSVCYRAATELVGSDNVGTADPPSMGAEDFADYLQTVPGCMMNLGVGKKDQTMTPLHTSRFDIDERALVLGARLLVRTLFCWSKFYESLGH
jgi:amidohydrolase